MKQKKLDKQWRRKQGPWDLRPPNFYLKETQYLSAPLKSRYGNMQIEF